MTNLFLVSHIFFLLAFIALLGALIIVIKLQHRQWLPMVLACLPVVMIFVTAYLGKHASAAHQVMNFFYDGLLIFNAFYFFRSGQRMTFILYILAIISTALDFAMHFVIRTM